MRLGSRPEATSLNWLVGNADSDIEELSPFIYTFAEDDQPHDQARR